MLRFGAGTMTITLIKFEPRADIGQMINLLRQAVPFHEFTVSLPY